MKTLKKYLNGRIDTITSVLALPRSAYIPETWHVLRVEIKKLNALFDLIDFCAKDFKRKKIRAPFKQVFKQAGKARELQLEIAMLEKDLASAPPNDFIAGLHALRKQEEEAYFSMVDKKLIRRVKKCRDKIAAALLRIKKKQVNRYMEHQTNQIKKIIHADALQPETLHELRKQLKILIYNRKSLSLEQPNPETNNTVLPDLLGEWHDLQVMAEHLKEELEAGGLNKEERAQLEAVHAQLSAGSQVLLEQIRQAIPASEFFAAPPSAT